MKMITIRLEDSVHKTLKKQLVDDESTFQELVSKLIDDELARREKKNN